MSSIPISPAKDKEEPKKDTGEKTTFSTGKDSATGAAKPDEQVRRGEKPAITKSLCPK